LLPTNTQYERIARYVYWSLTGLGLLLLSSLILHLCFEKVRTLVAKLSLSWQKLLAFGVLPLVFGGLLLGMGIYEIVLEAHNPDLFVRSVFPDYRLMRFCHVALGGVWVAASGIYLTCRCVIFLHRKRQQCVFAV